MRRNPPLAAATDAPRLYNKIEGLVNKLAALADDEPADSTGDAAKLLASVIPMVAKRASNILASAPASGPCQLSEALTRANLHLHYAAANHPKQFAHARNKLIWPSLRYGLAVREGHDELAFARPELGEATGVSCAGWPLFWVAVLNPEGLDSTGPKRA